MESRARGQFPDLILCYCRNLEKSTQMQPCERKMERQAEQEGFIPEQMARVQQKAYARMFTEVYNKEKWEEPECPSIIERCLNKW